jgi:hypothetical protein
MGGGVGGVGGVGGECDDGGRVSVWIEVGVVDADAASTASTGAG